MKENWPALPYTEWKDTCSTLHMWTQIVGKIRLSCTPWTNHSWHVALYVTARGLTTSPIPHKGKIFEIDFDFVDHELLIETNQGELRKLPLRPQSVADFYSEIMKAMRELNLEVHITKIPNEVAEGIPFDQDQKHHSYDRESANRFWQALTQVDRVFKAFRTRFIGKVSPIHFFWGSFDMAMTRFSGRKAPEHPGGVPNLPDWVVREAYSHEVSSAGFWPGGDQSPNAVFYSYAYPEPEGYSTTKVKPEKAFYSAEMKEFFLPYDEVRNAASPDSLLMEFLQSTYEAAANNGAWDREALERGE
jgi:hypothetical protein